MGIEHPQYESVISIFKTNKIKNSNNFSIDRLNVYNHGTPNQKALSCALFLSDCRLKGIDSSKAISQSLDFFNSMNQFGHQSIGSNYANEQGACDPHSALWLVAVSGILRESRLQKLNQLRDLCISYFADHLLMIDKFFTHNGVRIPCARAKAFGEQKLIPNFSIDSYLYALVNNLPTKDLQKPEISAIDLFLDSKDEFNFIIEQKKKNKLKLANKIRLWKTDDNNFISAMIEDQKIFDPCAWIIVENSNIIKSGRDLSTFIVPQDNPIVIG